MVIDCLAFLFGYFLYCIGENVPTLIVAQVLLGYPLINAVRNLQPELARVSLNLH